MRIDLDSFDQKQEDSKPVKKHERVKSDLVNVIMAEIPEEEKDSDFGDYGPESSDSDEDDYDSESHLEGEPEAQSEEKINLK